MSYILKRLSNYFIRGLLVLLPIGITVYLIYLLIDKVDSVFSIGFPGLGLIVVIVGITLVGLLFSGFIGRAILKLSDKLIESIPFVKIIYGSIKDMIEAFVGDKKKFNEAVLVEMGNKDLQTIGFVTRKDLEVLGLPDKVAVYFPLSYSLTGHVMLVHKDRITYLDINAAEAMKFAISGGVTGLSDEPVKE